MSDFAVRFSKNVLKIFIPGWVSHDDEMAEFTDVLQKNGADGLRQYHAEHAGFPEWPDSQGISTEMAVAYAGADVIAAYAELGGTFSAEQDQNGYTSAIYAIFAGPEAIAAYAKAGGPFPKLQDNEGMTLGMHVAMRGVAHIRAYTAAGNTFGLEVDKDGMTAGMYAAMRGAEAIEAFSAGGGIFTTQRDKKYHVTAAMFASQQGPDAIKAYAKAGGIFTHQKDVFGNTVVERIPDIKLGSQSAMDSLDALETALISQRNRGIRTRLELFERVTKARRQVLLNNAYKKAAREITTRYNLWEKDEAAIIKILEETIPYRDGVPIVDHKRKPRSSLGYGSLTQE
ncbi:MAG: hypothetical protein PHE27_00595 [Alphaproteobacteria bacterium]|nr:hypothetical protein [Alphaproteobacteria bacterium]